MNGVKVVIVDYGLGNLFSVERALRKLGCSNVLISDKPNDIRMADRLILPGVGAFGDGMNNLTLKGLPQVIAEVTVSGVPLLGVCLGMQILMSSSEEFGYHKGLDLVKGKVRRLKPSGDSRSKIPQIGWNSLYRPLDEVDPRNVWEGTLLQYIRNGAFMYFLHSYVVEPSESDITLSTTVYNGDSFCSAFSQDNITGVQFHPERSGEEGLEIYRAFIK